MDITNRKLSPYFILSLVLAAIIIVLTLTKNTDPSCDSMKTIPTSVKVKLSEDLKYVGFDLNKQNLTFGTLSPGAMSKRTASSEYNKNATTYIWAEGDFSSWVIISPKQFKTISQIPQEVVFTVLVPSTTQEREYKGKIIFCYQDI